MIFAWRHSAFTLSPFKLSSSKMSAKKRKNQSPWSSCDYCNVIIAHKDSQLHQEKSCPPNLRSWLHSFVHDEKLYSTIDTFQLQDKNLELTPKESRSDFVLMPYHVLQICKIPIGDPVVVKVVKQDESSISFVKTAWPTTQEKISDFTVALPNDSLEVYNVEPKTQVIISKLPEVFCAETITVVCESDINSSDLGIILMRLQKQNTNKLYCVGNKFYFRHYGCKLLFRVVEISSNVENKSESTESFHLITLETKWKYFSPDMETDEGDSKNLLNKLGGLNEIISELKDFISIALSGKEIFPGLPLTRGILIHGPSGTGKSQLIKALAQNFTRNVFRIECSEILSKFVGETEKELQNIFDKAKQMSPSIILVDDLDVLCSKSSSTSEFEKRITATLSMLMDKLGSDSETNVVVLGTTSKIHQIEKMLRCPSRFGKEVEIYVPNSPQRFEILNVLLSEVNHGLTEAEIKSIADSCHGFVGADLASLVSKAVLKNYKRENKEGQVLIEDFQWALSKVKPSAMREIMIEVPNVKWSDIGGQEELKLKLKQSIEWPLKYGEAFDKMGITPPKGVLMFGPPGCSKTMIAKALATESKLNFISVKGPELFSKWVGESERAVRKVFRRARQTAPSIIFFDELDAIGGERNISSGSNVQERVLAQLLTELDGVESLDNVTVIAATNRLDRIDPALIRPGRLDRIIYVPLPDAKTRYEIFKLQLKKTPITDDVVVEDLVEKTEGYSGAEIVAVCREAALKALEENIDADIVSEKHFLEALKIVLPRTPKSLLEMYDKYLINQ